MLARQFTYPVKSGETPVRRIKRQEGQKGDARPKQDEDVKQIKDIA